MSELLPRIHPDDYCNEDLPALSQPWWQTLPSDFHAMPDHFLAVCRLDNLVTVVPENGCRDFPDAFIVLDNQDTTVSVQCCV